MGVSNDERANAVAQWFARADTQIKRANSTTEASKANVAQTKATAALGKKTLAADRARQKNGVKYLPGQAPNENLSAAPTLHLIDGKTVKGTANAGGVLSDSSGNAINNPGGNAPALSRDQFLDTMSEQRKKDMPWLSTLSDIAAGVAKNTPLGDIQNYLFNNSDPLGRPQNFGQGVINALSTPLYAVAEGSHAVGQAAAENEAKGLKHDLNPLGPAGAIGSIGTFLSGAGRGVSEGFGARYADNPTPRTLGSNLEELGTQKALEGALGKQAGATAQGILGGTADIVGDPSTWLTLGAGAAAKGASTGAREAAAAARAAAREAAGVAPRAAEDASVLAERYLGRTPTAKETAAAAKATTNPAEVNAALRQAAAGEGGATPQPLLTPWQGALAGARKGFGENVLRPTFSAPRLSKDSRVAGKEFREAQKILSPEEFKTVQASTTRANLLPALRDAAERKKATGEAFGAEDFGDAAAAIPKGLTGVLDPEAATARAAGINTLLPKLATRDVPTESILARATTEGAGGTIDDAEHAALQQAIATSTSPAAWQSAEAALRRNASTRAFLDSTMKVGTREMKVAEAARKLATGDPLSPAYERFQEALNSAVTQAKGRAGTVDVQALRDALGAEGLQPQVANTNLVTQLNGVPYEARKNLLQTVIGGGRTFKTFDEAMSAAVSGSVDASMMRTMLKRLGLKVKSADPTALRRQLDGAGRTNWEQIKASVRTPQEVLDIHGIDDTAVAAARGIDVPGELEGATRMHDEATRASFGYDPTRIGPLKRNGRITGDSTGAAIWEAQQKLGTLFRKGQATEAYDITALREVHSAIMRELSQTANVRGLSGAERAAYLLPRYRQATRTVESGNLAAGIMPRIVSEKNAVEPLFVSWGQIVDELPDDVAARALFAPDFSRATHGTEKEGGFKQGFTAYPTIIADGVRAAANGAPADTVAIMMRQGHGNISSTVKDLPELDAIYRELADVITAPAFVAKMNALDAAQQPMAYALSQAAADGIVTPLSERIIALVNRGEDQGATSAEIYKAISDARREASSAAGYPSLVSDSVQQRMDNGFVNGVLGEYGSLVLNAQERMVRASKVKTAARGGRKDTEFTKARIATLADNEPYINAAAGVGRGANEAEELANLETGWDLMGMPASIYGSTQRVGVAMSAGFGMDDMKNVLQTERTASYLVSGEFRRGLSDWMLGKPSGFTRSLTGGLGEKIAAGRGLGTPVSAEVSTNYLRDWWNALAAAPSGMTGDDLARSLRVGKPAQGIVAGARGLDEWELPHAVQLKQFIDQVFNEGEAGLFARGGIPTDELLRQLNRSSSFGAGKAFGDMKPAAGTALDEQASLWRSFDVSAVNPLEVLDNYMSAMSTASVKPSMGAELSKLWGHYSPSADEIKTLGLKRLNTVGAEADLARFVDPNAYFSTAERRQLAFVQQALNYSTNFTGGMGTLVRGYDALTRVLKSSATVWRPGHHVTNILGDMFANVMAGVNPFHAIRAVKMMRRWGQLLDADMGPLDRWARASAAPGRQADIGAADRFGKDFVIVKVNGKPQPVSLDEAMQWAHRTGVAQTHAGTLDLNDLNAGSVTGPRSAVGKVLHNTIGRADNALTEFSALRDNLTRLPHFIHALEKGEYKSLDEAIMRAAAEVHDFHPTYAGLSGFEQKYARRAFYFYTWTRLMISRIIRSAMDHPGIVTIPSKFQFEMASANGLNPESIGVPFDPDNENIPDYHRESLLGPTYFGGLTPVPDPNGETSWGYSLSSPQLDTLQTLFEGANTAPGQTGLQGLGNQAATGTYDLVAGSLNPLLKAPGVLLTGKDPSSTDMREVDRGKWLADQGGILTTGSKLTGAYQQAFPGAIDPKTGQPYKSQEQVDADTQRTLLNALTGLKFTSYDDATSAAVAASQRKAREKAAARLH